MSVQDNIIWRISKLPKSACGLGARQEDIEKLACAFGSTLPNDFEAFLSEYGWLEFGSTEIPGLGQDVPTHLDLLLIACDYWNNGLSKRFLPIYSSGSDWIYCVDSENAGNVVVVSNEEGEYVLDERMGPWSVWFRSMFCEED